MSVTGTEAKIMDAVLAYLRQLELDGFSPTLAIAMPFVGFDPPAGPYLQASWLPADTETRTVSLAGSNRHRGVLQVSVFWPRGGTDEEGPGLIPAGQVASQIAAHFKYGTRISANGVTVTVPRQPSIGRPLEEPDRLQVPVSIPWQCFAAA